MKRTLGLLALLFTLHIYADTKEEQMTDKKTASRCCFG